MLTEQMIRLISTYTIGCVATVRRDGAPAVSPKGTFIVIDDRTIAFANIRSAGTIENIRREPQVEVNFIDVFGRQGCRVRGLARYTPMGLVQPNQRRLFEEKWPELYDLIEGVVWVDVTEAQSLCSPSYDKGAVEGELSDHWLMHYATGLGFPVIRRSE